MDKAKYVVFDSAPGDFHKIDTMILFPGWVSHKTIARALGSAECHPISAGFINDMGQVYGRSETTKLSSRPEDQVLYDLMMKERY